MPDLVVERTTGLTPSGDHAVNFGVDLLPMLRQEIELGITDRRWSVQDRASRLQMDAKCAIEHVRCSDSRRLC